MKFTAIRFPRSIFLNQPSIAAHLLNQPNMIGLNLSKVRNKLGSQKRSSLMMDNVSVGKLVT